MVIAEYMYISETFISKHKMIMFLNRIKEHIAKNINIILPRFHKKILEIEEKKMKNR